RGGVGEEGDDSHGAVVWASRERERPEWAHSGRSRSRLAGLDYTIPHARRRPHSRPSTATNNTSTNGRNHFCLSRRQSGYGFGFGVLTVGGWAFKSSRNFGNWSARRATSTAVPLSAFSRASRNSGLAAGRSISSDTSG